MRINVTKHAEKRIKQRVGLPRSAVKRHAKIAYRKGRTRKEVKGMAGRYLDKIFLKYRTANNLRIYGEFIYIYCDYDLVTVLNLPKRFRSKTFYVR